MSRMSVSTGSSSAPGKPLKSPLRNATMPLSPGDGPRAPRTPLAPRAATHTGKIITKRAQRRDGSANKTKT
jgi:hypothetical protein